MPLIATRGNAAAGGYGWSTLVPVPIDGMALLTPSSVDKGGSGSTATITAKGSVEYSLCTSLSLNGIFSSQYDNYVVVQWGTESQSDQYSFRLRASGTDNSTANSYTRQSFLASGTAETASRATSDFSILNSGSQVSQTGFVATFFAPFIAQPTVVHSSTINDSGGAQIYDYGTYHNQSTAYDGFTIYRGVGTMNGLISVYGLEN